MNQTKTPGIGPIVLALAVVAGISGCIALGISLPAKAWADAKVWTEVVRREARLDMAGEFELHNASGAVTIHAWDKPELRIVAVKEAVESVHRYDEAVATQLLERVRVDVRSNEQRCTVRTEFPAMEPLVTLRVTFEVWAPRGASARIHLSNGAITVRDLGGAVNAQTSNGEIMLVNVAGPVTAESSNGAISVDEAAGSVQARSSNGAITVRHPAALESGARIACTTSNGEIIVALGAESAFLLDAATSNGSVRSGFALDPGATVRRARVAGSVSGGDAAVRLETTNGAITLRPV